MPEDPPYVPEDPSRVLAGRYRLLTVLGAGGMGVVWRARDELLHQTVAVKEVALPLRLTAEDRERRLRRTLREARTAASLRGRPGIVTVYDVVEEDGRPWIVMELVEGPSLAKVIKDEGRLTEARVARIGLRVVSALVSAEAAGIVHRDVKPANILLGSDRNGGGDGDDGNDRAVLTDFGIAAAVHDTTDLTGTGQLLGTIPYLAPERLGGERASAAADLWAAGVTLYEAVEGRRPFDRESPVATIAAIVNQPPAPARYADRLLPVIEGMLRKDPAERLTAPQVTALLTPIAAGTPGERPCPAEDPGATDGGGRIRSGSSGVTDLARRGDPGRSGTPWRPSSRVAAAAAVSLAAAAVAAVVIWSPGTFGLGGTPTPASGGAATASGKDPATSPNPNPDPNPASASAPAGGTASPGDPRQDPPPSPGQTPPPSTGQSPPPSPGRNPLPHGFTLHTDRRGFSIAVPDGWTKDEEGDGEQVSWERPKDSVLSPSSWYLGVFANPKRKETRDPADILDQLRDALQDSMIASGSYREFTRRQVPVAGGEGAELEFGFAHRSASNLPHRLYARCVTRDSGGTAMFWFFTPAGQWAEAGRHVDTFMETFRLD
ncbi:serine/threonine-protein kinase [Streptosporangium sp. V21-05]|uniref:serine/threonine-protein kinase n=1 Tax=Streptosporangium sp. V21-05 TaxID=3446115 RepID=UPI003F52BD4D